MYLNLNITCRCKSLQKKIMQLADPKQHFAYKKALKLLIQNKGFTKAKRIKRQLFDYYALPKHQSATFAGQCPALEHCWIQAL